MMNMNKTTGFQFICFLFLFAVLNSCSTKYETSVDCVNAFIKSAEDHDMTKAWNTLSPEAQAFYNDLGIKNRKSGRGILEHDINEVKKFRENSGFRIDVQQNDKNKLILTTKDSETFIIETTEIDGSYKIKDAVSVRNVLKGIASEIVKKEYY